MNARIKPNAGTGSSSAEADAEAQWLTIDVAKIRPYARNPRRSDNREYARIKASIRRDGLLWTASTSMAGQTTIILAGRASDDCR